MKKPTSTLACLSPAAACRLSEVVMLARSRRGRWSRRDAVRYRSPPFVNSFITTCALPAQNTGRGGRKPWPNNR
jgi:hypothetical protein